MVHLPPPPLSHALTSLFVGSDMITRHPFAATQPITPLIPTYVMGSPVIVPVVGSIQSDNPVALDLFERKYTSFSPFSMDEHAFIDQYLLHFWHGIFF